jgi:hypothetical protein
MEIPKNDQLVEEITDFCLERIQSPSKKSGEAQSTIFAIITALLTIGTQPATNFKLSMWFAET